MENKSLETRIALLEEQIDDYQCWEPVFFDCAIRCFYEMRHLINRDFYIDAVDPSYKWLDENTFQFTLKVDGEYDDMSETQR